MAKDDKEEISLEELIENEVGLFLKALAQPACLAAVVLRSWPCFVFSCSTMLGRFFNYSRKACRLLKSFEVCIRDCTYRASSSCF